MLNLLIIIFCIITLSYAKTENNLEAFLLSINQLQADLLLYKKMKKTEVISIGKNSKIYTFIVENKKIKLKSTDYIPFIERRKIKIGDLIYDLKTHRVYEEKQQKKEKFILEEKNDKWYLYFKEGKKKKLRFKSKSKPIIFENLKEPFLLIPKSNKIEVYYIKPPKFFPKIIKRIPLFEGYTFETFLCYKTLFILEKSPQYKEAFLFVFDIRTKKLLKKLKIKSWEYTTVGCSTDGIVLSKESNFYNLSSKGKIEPVRKIKINEKPYKPEGKTIQTGLLEKVWFLKDFYIIKPKNKKTAIYDKKLNFIQEIQTLPHTEFFQIKNRIYSVYKDEKKLCVYQLKEEKEEKLFCKTILPDYEYKISKLKLFLLDKKEKVFYVYDLHGNKILKEKLPSYIKVFSLTKYGVFYVDENLVHLKPDGDFEIYQIKPEKIRDVDSYVLFFTKKGNYFFDSNKIVYLGKNCEPFGKFILCDEKFFNLYSIYPKKLKYFFIGRPICNLENSFLFFENLDDKKVIKLYSKKEKKLKQYFYLPEKSNGFKCWDNKIIILFPDKIEFIFP